MEKQKNTNSKGTHPVRQEGASAIMTGIMLFALVGIGALALDMGHLYVVTNELHNAADAGALAGARHLYNVDGTVNAGANAIAAAVATVNKSDKIPVEVDSADVQRGHWNPDTRVFTLNDSLEPVDLAEVSAEALNANTDLINAVRVSTHRGPANPALSFLAGIFGFTGFSKSRGAIAYIGFAGSMGSPGAPIVICKESILEDSLYSCNVGRMINSGNNVSTSETGEWSNMDQGDNSGCAGTAPTNPTSVKPLICGQATSDPVVYGKFISTTNGMNQSVFGSSNTKDECTLLYRWKHSMYDTDGDNVPDAPTDTDGDGLPDKRWNMTLPVVECGTSGPNCKKVVGAVNVNVIWITGAGDDPTYSGAPRKMEDWTCSTPADGSACWNDFVKHFNLVNVDGSPAPYSQKSIYFEPDCTPHTPTGITGGDNFGVLAEIPVLVQ